MSSTVPHSADTSQLRTPIDTGESPNRSKSRRLEKAAARSAVRAEVDARRIASRRDNVLGTTYSAQAACGGGPEWDGGRNEGPPPRGGLGRRPGAGPLANYVKDSSQGSIAVKFNSRIRALWRPEKVDRERARWDALHVLWKISERKNVRKCKRVLRTSGGHVGVRVSEHGAGFSGLATCASPWLCPLCSARIAAQRAMEVAQAIKWCEDRGGEVVHVVLTASHNKGHRLKVCWDAVSKGWAAVTSGSGWLNDKERFGVEGWLRVVETTYGDQHGWHVHVHALLFLDRKVSQNTADDLGLRLYERWGNGLAKKGMTSQRIDRNGVDVGLSVTRGSEYKHSEVLGGYFSKLVYEATHGSQKFGKVTDDGARHRTPFEILADLVAMLDPRTGELKDGYDPAAFEADLKLWKEWEQGSKNRQQMTWMDRGAFRELIGIDDVSDEQAAEENLGDEDRLWLPIKTWQTVRWYAWRIRRIAEEQGIAGLRHYLDRHGLAYETTKPVEPGE